VNDTSRAAPKPQERVYHGEVVGINAHTNSGGWKTYRVEIAAADATLYVTLPEAVPLWQAWDLVLRPAPANGKPPPIESES
jgi:hypothetical protein